MEQAIYIREKFKIPKIGKIPVYFFLVGFVFLSAVLQDYIYSNIKQTGFYISESMLYNTLWLLFIPFSVLINRFIRKINPKNKVGKLPLNLVAGIAFSFIHILFFTALFVSVSNLVFTPPHRFSVIFNTALSNQFYIVLLWYTIFPAIFISKHKQPRLTHHYSEKAKLKIGRKIITIPTATIQLIMTDKPYVKVCTNDQKFLDNKSLKEFESELDPAIFLRVHRSAIINVTYIKEMKSRNNGDYDAKMGNGQIIRLSRHYRNNWHQLLQ
jgi:two-component system LytT family response regulator